LHSENIAHLDIKPANVIFNEYQKKFFFIDFGTSKKYWQKSENTMQYKEKIPYTGTKFYSSPEMIKEIEQDPFKSDIFSLGVTFLEVAMLPKTLTSQLLKSSNEIWDPQSNHYPYLSINLHDDKKLIDKIINDSFSLYPLHQIFIDYFIAREKRKKDENIQKASIPSDSKKPQCEYVH
jgi:serine/threonine protein kinase